jgi:hypothetical protein
MIIEIRAQPFRSKIPIPVAIPQIPGRIITSIPNRAVAVAA